MITVILNAFKRQNYLKQQIDCVFSQTVPISRVMVWNNGASLNVSEYGDKVMIANHSNNLGVWSRFAYAINAETDYICVLDDDTFPSSRFFESCLKQMDVEPALLGTRGLRFLSPSRYQPFISFGWDAPNEKTEIVDIVGHAWFFKREWLSTYWRELPPVGTTRLVGEDIHFSFMLQKYLGVRTMVPPHPLNDITVWGSNPKLALLLGTSKEAISQSKNALSEFDMALRQSTQKGFVLYKDHSDTLSKHFVLGSGVHRIRFLKTLAKRYPRFGYWARLIRQKLYEKNIHI
jgi:glycosyltransferase involved in cell wall biosynthesis